jgi:hypothetical protein
MFLVDGLVVADAEGTHGIRIVTPTLRLDVLNTAVPFIRMDMAFAFRRRQTRESCSEGHELRIVCREL